MTSWGASQRGRKGRDNLTISAVFKTLLGLYMPVSILEEEIEDRQRGKISRSKFSNVILEAGGLLSDQEK